MSWQELHGPATLLHSMAEQQVRVADRIKQIREDHALTQEQAAARAGVTHRQWQRWELDESTPYKSSIDKLARAFGIAPSEFFAPSDADSAAARLSVAENELADLRRRIALIEEHLRLAPPSEEDESLEPPASLLHDDGDERPSRRGRRRSG